VISIATLLSDDERHHPTIAAYIHDENGSDDINGDDSNNSPSSGSIWSDGLLLCQLVQRLPGSSVTLRGVDPHPRARAQCLHNINQALSVLRLQRKMPVTWLWSAHDIVDGNRVVVRRLLLHMRTLWPPPLPVHAIHTTNGHGSLSARAHTSLQRSLAAQHVLPKRPALAIVKS
jgi:hypothetical protein